MLLIVPKNSLSRKMQPRNPTLAMNSKTSSLACQVPQARSIWPQIYVRTAAWLYRVVTISRSNQPTKTRTTSRALNVSARGSRSLAFHRCFEPDLKPTIRQLITHPSSKSSFRGLAARKPTRRQEHTTKAITATHIAQNPNIPTYISPHVHVHTLLIRASSTILRGMLSPFLTKP